MNDMTPACSARPSRALQRLRPAILLAGSVIATTPATAEIRVVSDFPGGSAATVSVSQQAQHVTIRPDGDPQRGWPCWWYCRLDGVQPGRPLQVTVDASQLKQASGRPLSPNWALPQQATYSDDGQTWKHTRNGARSGASSTWTLQPRGDQVWVAWGPPFTLKDAISLTERMADHESARVFQLCRTRAGRPVPAVFVTEVSEDQRDQAPVIWAQARQHAWEAGASWVACGFGEWLTSDDPAAAALRRNALVYLVPVMDVDNVETGNGGKNQLPQDHNRDWTSEPHWPAVQAAIEQLRAAHTHREVALFVDLHNPGPNDLRPFFFIPPEELMSATTRESVRRFLQLCRDEMRGPLQLSESPRISGRGYDANWKKISKNWVAAELDAVAVTLETSWNTPGSTTDGYQTIGRQLGLAISRYLTQASESEQGDDASEP